MNRRGLLQGILAAGMAPAIVKAGILMPVRKIIVPETQMYEVLEIITGERIGPVHEPIYTPYPGGGYIVFCHSELTRKELLG